MTVNPNLPPSARQRIIGVAAAKGIPLGRIALNLGIAVSSVCSALTAYELKTGTRIERREFSLNRTGPKTLQFAACGHCRTPFRIVRRSRPGRSRLFCSAECKVLSQRKLSNADIVAIIESRKAGETWTGIARRCQMTVMCVQGNVWKYLRRNGLLTRETVRAIWRPSPSTHKRSFSNVTVVKQFGAIPPTLSRGMELPA